MGGSAGAILAERVIQTGSEPLPADVVEAAKGRLLDGLAVAIGGCALPPALVAIHSVPRSEGVCTVLATGETADLADAAFVNGVAAHCLLQEDFGRGGHPGTYVIPAALASAEERSASGRDLLTAIVAGYEAAAGMSAATSVALADRGFREVPVIGPLAAAAAAAIPMRLDTERIQAALNVALNLSGGLYEGFAVGSMEGYFHAGFAARNGCFAARLAEAGAVTAARTLEGTHGFFRTFGGIESGHKCSSGDRFAILDITHKPFPACAYNQQTIHMITTGALPRLTGDQIERVVLRRPFRGPNGVDAPGVTDGPPYDTMLQAQMSAKFTAAAALLGRPVDDAAFFRSEYSDPEVTAIAQRMDLVVEDRSDIAIEIELRDGRSHAIGGEFTADLCPSLDEMKSKFLRFAAPLVERAHEFVDTVDQLEQVDDVRDLSRQLRLTLRAS